MKKIYLLSLLFAVGVQAADDPMQGLLLRMMLQDIEGRIASLRAQQDNPSNQSNQRQPQESRESRDPFKRAIKAGDCAQVASYLDEHGNNIPEHAIHTSIKSKQKDVLQLLIDRGANINKKYKGDAPLHQAVAHPEAVVHSEMVKILLAAGALTEILETDLGATPLFMASAAGNADSCAQLLAQNASVHARSYNNATPLNAAAINNGSVAVMKQLIDAGSDMHAKDEKGCTPLIESIIQKHQEAALYLIGAGARLDMQDNNGDTALHHASGLTPNVAITKVLLAHKADIHKTNKKKRTPLHVAARTGTTEIVQELIASGADVWATDTKSQWPLERAKTREVKQLLINVMHPTH